MFMQSEKSRQTVTKIRPYDGYQGRPLWEKDNRSTYYDYAADQQCRVPLPSVDELREELGMAPLPH